MPYLTQQVKDDLAKGKPVETLGELTYSLTKVCLDYPYEEWDAGLRRVVDDYLSRQGQESYQSYAEVLGCLLSTGLEWRRRVRSYTGEVVLAQFTEDFYESDVAPYEDQKIEENGDVY